MERKIDFSDLLNGEATKDPVYRAEYQRLILTEACFVRMIALNMNYKDLAKKAEVCEKTIRGFYRGDDTKFENVFKILKALQLRIEIKVVEE